MMKVVDVGTRTWSSAAPRITYDEEVPELRWGFEKCHTLPKTSSQRTHLNFVDGNGLALGVNTITVVSGHNWQDVVASPTTFWSLELFLADCESSRQYILDELLVSAIEHSCFSVSPFML